MSDTDDRQIILHIGYPKAASSFLRRDFFAPATENLIVPRGRYLDLLHAGRDITQVRRMILNLAPEPDRTIVVSNENLAGRSLWTPTGALDICRTWYEAFPESRIVIVIREQRDYVLSAYKYAVYTGHHLPRIEAFLRANRLPLLQKICYDKLIEAYQQRFGIDNVCVLPVEMLASDQAGFYDRLVKFTGLQRSTAPRGTVSNKSPSNWRYIEVLRQANAVLRYVASTERALRRLRQGNRVDDGAHRIVVYRGIVDRFAGLCGQSSFDGQLFDPDEEAMIAESNRVTARLTRLDLKRYDYL